MGRLQRGEQVRRRTRRFGIDQMLDGLPVVGRVKFGADKAPRVTQRYDALAANAHKWRIDGIATIRVLPNDTLCEIERHRAEMLFGLRIARNANVECVGFVGIVPKIAHLVARLRHVLPRLDRILRRIMQNRRSVVHAIAPLAENNEIFGHSAACARGVEIADERQSIEETDLETAIAQLNAQNLTLEAARAAFARVNQQSLFDLLS